MASNIDDWLRANHREKTLKIGLQTWGSDGDINPFIALAGGLAAVGHEVTLAITAVERKDYSHYADKLNFQLAQVSYVTDSDEELRLMSGKLNHFHKPIDQVRFIVQEMFEPRVEAHYQTARELAHANDLLVGHFIHHPFQLAAELAKKPYVTLTLNHSAIPSRFVPPPLTPNLGPWLNPWIWKLAFALLNKVMLPGINRLRTVEGASTVHSCREVFESPLCNLIAVSRIFCAEQHDWDSHQQVCGFFSLPDQARPWAMPDSLKQFLDAGEPPVYMTFGSMLGKAHTGEHITRRTRLLVDAAKLAGCRAIIQSHWENVLDMDEDERIYRMDPAPHSQIFPHCAAVVHHGGAGTTQTALTHGLPSVIVAHIADQY
ncbi:MAG: glycosyltransferase, partial [Candidatus Methylumidiphilus sp.]